MSLPSAPTQPVPSRSYAQLCGIAAALDVIGDRWAILIVRDLLWGPLRFADLAEGLPGSGTNTLTARLKQLELAGVLARRPQALPERGTVYDLTDYGRQLQPILMALGRWGSQSMHRLPADRNTRSRWLLAALPAFRDAGRVVSRPTTWQLQLDDGAFTVRADPDTFTVALGAPPEPERPDVVITTTDHVLLGLLSGQVMPADAVAAGVLRVDGDLGLVEQLVQLCPFR